MLVRATLVPPGAAGPLSVTVPVTFTPPPTVDGVRLSATRADGLTVNTADLLNVPSPALIVTVIDEFTPSVFKVNAAVVAPAGTVTEDGALTLELLELSGTVTPPVPAFAASVTLPITIFPPRIVFTLRLSLSIFAVLTTYGLIDVASVPNVVT